MLKKILSAVMAIVMVAGAGNSVTNAPYSTAPLTASAEEYAYGDLTYKIYDKGYGDQPKYISITGCDKSFEGELVIPEYIDGVTVEFIGDSAFKDCTGIMSITTPETVHYIGSSAFEGCTGLTSITLSNQPPDSYWAYQIENYIFRGCTSLTSITLPERIGHISTGAFFGCTALSSVTLPDDLYRIYNSAFENCTSLSSITIPDNTREIGGSAFANCTSLTSIELPDGIREIGGNAFKDCISLTSLTLPDTVTNIDSSAFMGCSKLASINIPEGIKAIKRNTFNGCSSLTSITFPESITSIEKNSFSNSGLTSVTFPENGESVTIAESAFENTNITDLTIKFKSKIEKNAFIGCKSLLNVDLVDAHILKGSFANCSSLKEMKFSSTVVLEAMSVTDCPELENIGFTNCVVTFENAFNNCPMLFNINSSPVFDSDTGDFVTNWRDFIFRHFNGSDDVGFINQYVLAQIDKVVDEYITEDMSDLQKVMTMHDWVCENTKFTEGNTKDKENHSDSSVFMNDYSVCEGYAKACNLLYHAAGIETYYVQSPSHAWNIVNIDGHYFHVDSTWDDGEPISRDWFLKSDEELKAAGRSHADWELLVPSSLHRFQKKVLPECRYKMGDVNLDGILDAADASDVLQAYADLSTNQNTNTDPILADYNLDGIVDSTDASDILAYYAYQSTH